MLTLRSVISSLCLFMLTFGLVSCRYETNNQTSADNHKKNLSVMSFNIRYGDADDGENSWPNRKDMICTFIGEQKPEIAGLQETMHYQIDTITAANPDYAFVGVGRNDGNSAENAALLKRDFTPFHLTPFKLVIRLYNIRPII